MNRLTLSGVLHRNLSKDGIIVFAFLLRLCYNETKINSNLTERISSKNVLR